MIGTVDVNHIKFWYNLLVYVCALYNRHVIDSGVSVEPSASIFSVELLSENLKSSSGKENTDEASRVHILDPFQGYN
jgi:hypothetical protein